MWGGVSYRFVKLAWHYPGYLDDFCRRRPPRKEHDYETGAAELHADAFGWADFYSRNLRALGVEAYELVANADWLQAAWAREHGCAQTGDALVLEQLGRLRPDVLFVQDMFRFGAGFIRAARERVPRLRLVLGWCCAPYTNADVGAFRSCDALLTCTPGFVVDFSTAGHRAFLLNHAFEPTVLERMPDAPPIEADVVFAGTVVKGRRWHDLRARLLEHLVKAGFGLQVFGSLIVESSLRTRGKQLAWVGMQALRGVGLAGVADWVGFLRRAQSWRTRPTVERFPEALMAAVRPPIFGRVMYERLRSARVALNAHIDVTPRFAGNMRLFEATGVGTCLLTDWKENLGDLFEVDSEVVAYRSLDECSEKLRWLLANESGRRAIADAGQRRTLRDHTFALRAIQLDGIIRELLAAV